MMALRAHWKFSLGDEPWIPYQLSGLKLYYLQRLKKTKGCNMSRKT